MDQPNPEPSCSNAGRPCDVPEIVTTHLGDSLERERATEIAPGVTLFTKDGSNTGNAIIVKKVGQTRDFNMELDDMLGDQPNPPFPRIIDVWHCETDFGNTMNLSVNEILSGYWLGYQTDYDSWWDDRLALIKRTIEP